jgi:hypothetical protein
MIFHIDRRFAYRKADCSSPGYEIKRLPLYFSLDKVRYPITDIIACGRRLINLVD